MKNILEYKGYFAKIEYSAEDNVLFGKIEGIRDLVNFESTSSEEIKKEFESAVDDYLEFCEMVGKSPDRSYRGSFNIRIDPELHKAISMLAMKNGDSLNQTVEKAIKSYVEGDPHTDADRIADSINNLWKMLALQNTYGINQSDNLVHTESFLDEKFNMYGNNEIKLIYNNGRPS